MPQSHWLPPCATRWMQPADRMHLLTAQTCLAIMRALTVGNGCLVALQSDAKTLFYYLVGKAGGALRAGIR